ncbi:MAG: bifunctional hydroxymethylpyrimidine kinase/phosphomethylpyrimidine kinase [Spirochaetota bacterium]
MAQTMKQTPIALSIAGSDSGGGAGIQADLKTFTAQQVFGTTAITCITAQNPQGVTAIQEINVEVVEKQILAVLNFFPVAVVKTGMLFSQEIIQIVFQTLHKRSLPFVLDPVMVATSGAVLLQEGAIQSLRDELLGIATVFTPNADEAEILLGDKIADYKGLEDATHSLFQKYRIPVLLKGGHRNDNNIATDYLYDGNAMHSYSKKFIADAETHGTGCTYSSAIAAQLALGKPLPEAVRQAREYLHQSIRESLWLGSTKSLSHQVTIKNEDTKP